MTDPLFTDRQVQIINAAIKLIGQGGIQLLTTRNLAKEVGVTEPALYRHFTGKIDILKQVLEYLRYRIICRLESIVNTKSTPSEKLEQLVRRQFAAFVHRPEVVVVLLSEGLYQHNQDLSKLVYAIMQESADFYVKVIAQGQQTGEFRMDVPARRIVSLIMGSMRFCVIQWYLSGFSYDLIPKGDEILSTFFTLLRPSS